MTAQANLDEDPLVRRWERVLKDKYRGRVNEVLLEWPRKRAIEIPWWELEEADHDLAVRILRDPYTLNFAAFALKNWEPPFDAQDDTPLSIAWRAGEVNLTVRPIQLPAALDARVDVRDLRTEHLGRLVAVRGLIKKTTSIHGKIETALFICGRCLAPIRIPQDQVDRLTKPVECYEDQGGCGRTSTWKLVADPSDASDLTKGRTSLVIDTQKIELQENPEGLRGGSNPQRLVARLGQDLVGAVNAGDRVVLNGIPRAKIRRDGQAETPYIDTYLDVISVEIEEQEFEDVLITAEDEEDIRREARNPDLWDNMRQSVAPDIHGLDIVKEALLLQQLGGVNKRLPGGMELRGDIHILLIGDPGVAKSKLLRHASRFAPRGIYVSGKASTGAGLTAAAVKDEWGEGRWTLEAGAAVLADGGMLACDEMDKMGKEDQSSMHEVLEDQCISVAKAGIQATLHTRICLLGAANPRYGRFDENQAIADQINFPPALLSRFDLIFVLTDIPDDVRDRELARHILDRHELGSRIAQDSNARSTLDHAPYEPEFLRKYVAYARRVCKPALTPAAKELLQDYYVRVRRQARANNSPIPLTPRQLDALTRLSEGSARIRLSQTVEPEDAERAIRIVEAYLTRLNRANGGIMDADTHVAGIQTAQRERVKLMLQIMRDLTANGRAVHRLDVLGAAMDKGMDRERAESTFDRLHKDSMVMRVGEDAWRLTL